MGEAIPTSAPHKKSRNVITLPVVIINYFERAREKVRGSWRKWRNVEHTGLYSSLNINPLTPNDPHSGRTAPLTSKRCILYIY
jgi:hypothetical protein